MQRNSAAEAEQVSAEVRDAELMLLIAQRDTTALEQLYALIPTRVREGRERGPRGGDGVVDVCHPTHGDRTDHIVQLVVAIGVALHQEARNVIVIG